MKVLGEKDKKHNQYKKSEGWVTTSNTMNKLPTNVDSCLFF